jgi:outer membrane lipoprotein carrier protein
VRHMSPHTHGVPHPSRNLIARWVEAVGVLRHISFLVMFVGALCRASGALSQTPLELAARVDHHYNALHSLRVDFIQQYEGLGQHRRESGVLLLKKPGRMKWTYSQPEGKLFVLDGHNAYFYSPGQTEVQRVAAKKLDDLRSPLRFLLGHAELAKELTSLQTTPQGENYVLSGVPRNMEQRVSSLHFTVSPGGSILGIKIEEVDGSVSTFTFTEEVPNPPSSDADFVFHAPAGTEIVDGLPPA